MVEFRSATAADSDAICGLWVLVERRFLESGVNKLRVSVFDDNVGALRFWRELDYIELPEIHYFTKEL